MDDQLFTDLPGHENRNPDYQEISTRDRKTLLALAGMQMDKAVLAGMLSLFGVNSELLHFLEGPVIVHQSGWSSMIPDWLIEQVTVERLRIVVDEHNRNIVNTTVGPTELCAVMMPATFDAPMRSELAQIYCWAGAHARALKDGVPLDEIWPHVGWPVPDADVLEKSGRYHQDYIELTTQIRRRVVKAQKTRSRASRKAQEADSKPNEHDVVAEQLSLL